jgi:hypothetical protein
MLKQLSGHMATTGLKREETENFDVETRRETSIWHFQKGDMMKILRQVVEKCVLKKGR